MSVVSRHRRMQLSASVLLFLAIFGAGAFAQAPQDAALGELDAFVANQSHADEVWINALGSISGYVYESDGSTAVTQGQVSVLSVNGHEWLDSASPDTNGSYTVAGLPAGDYKLQVQDAPLGFAPEYYDGATDYESAVVVSVGDGEAVTDINFTLEPGGAICGYVYETNGVTPIEGENVNASPVGDEQEWTGSQTDSNGFYYILISTGDYAVVAGGNLGYINEYYQESADRDGAQVVQVAVGVVTSNIDFTLAFGASISGHVYAADGATAVTQGWVSVLSASGWDWLGGSSLDTNGSYSISGLSAGDYKLQVEDVPFGFAPEYYDGATDYESAVVVSVGDQESVTDIDFTLEPGGAICGHVYETNGVTPIEGENVNASPVGDEQEWTGSQTDSDGFYYILISTGDYAVVAGGNLGYINEYYQESADRDGAQVVQVAVGVVTSNIDFTLAFGASISGHVYAADGATAVTQGWVSVLSASGWDWLGGSSLDTNGSYSISGLSAGDYKLQVEDVPFGFAPEYYDGATDYESAVVVSVGDQESVTDIDFTLEPGGAICGYVYETDGVTPIEGENVHVSPVGDEQGGTGRETDSDGSYCIAVSTGDYTVVAGGNLGFIREYYEESPDSGGAQAVTVTAGVLTSNVNFTLAMGSSISGHVYETDGTTAVTQGWVSALSVSGHQWLGNSSLAPDGGYSISGLSAGDYKLHVEDVPLGFAPEYYDGATDYESAVVVSVGDGEAVTDIDFTLEPGGAICGYVYETNGVTPIEGENVNASPVGDEQGGTGRQTDSNGFYSILVPVGSYKAEAGGGGAHIREYYDEKTDWDTADVVVVSAGQVTSNVNFTLELGAIIMGRVYEGDGVTPLANVGVWARITNDVYAEPFGDDETGTSGYYALSVAAGTYWVIAGEKDGFATECYEGASHITNGTPVVVQAGATVSNIDFTLDAAESGTIMMDVSPDTADWAVEMPWGERFYDSGDIGPFDAVTGLYTFTWQSLAGYDLPTNQPAVQMISAGQTGIIVGAYIPLDTDGDRAYDWQEWIAGTSSTNEEDFFHIESVTVSPNPGVVLTWSSVSGRLYKAYYTTNLAVPFWQPTGFATTSVIDGIISATNETPDPIVFYRLGVEEVLAP